MAFGLLRCSTMEEVINTASTAVAVDRICALPFLGNTLGRRAGRRLTCKNPLREAF